jgi:hypothetical protein
MPGRVGGFELRNWIESGAITAGMLGDNSVGTGELVAGAVTPAKVASTSPFHFSGDIMAGLVGVAFKGLYLIDEGSTALNLVKKITVSGGAIKIS